MPKSNEASPVQAGNSFPEEKYDPQVETANRTSDTEEESSEYFHKEFVVPKQSASEGMHEANKIFVLGEAIQRGLHPKADVQYGGSEDHPDGTSKRLFYKVKVVPAHTDESPSDTRTPTSSK